ncbi:MAG: hypothetical protein ACYC7D_00570 [Nitrososphaerales archaeon]
MHQRICAYEVHHYEARLRSALAALKEDSAIIPKDKELIRSHVKYKAAQGLSIPRRSRCICYLRKLSRFLNRKHFKDAWKEVIIDVIDKGFKPNYRFDRVPTGFPFLRGSSWYISNAWSDPDNNVLGLYTLIKRQKICPPKRRRSYEQ